MDYEIPDYDYPDFGFDEYGDWDAMQCSAGDYNAFEENQIFLDEAYERDDDYYDYPYDDPYDY